MGLACSCSDTELRKDLCSGNRDKAPQKLEGTFYFYENGPAHSFQPVSSLGVTAQAVMNANGDYLNRIVESAENYWTGANVTLKDRHRPVSTYRISGVVRKNKFLLTKAVSARPHFLGVRRVLRNWQVLQGLQTAEGSQSACQAAEGAEAAELVHKQHDKRGGHNKVLSELKVTTIEDYSLTFINLITG